MIRVTVKNQLGVVTHGTQLKTQLAVDHWIFMNEAVKAFGKPERWVYEDDLAALGEDKSKAIASEEVGSMEEDKRRYKFAAEYSIEQADITAEYNQGVLNEQSRKYLQETDWYVIRFAETGVAVPESVTQQRAACRAAIA